MEQVEVDGQAVFLAAAGDPERAPNARPGGGDMLDYNERQAAWDTWRELHAGWEEPQTPVVPAEGPVSGRDPSAASQEGAGSDPTGAPHRAGEGP